jgi:hypothetical protein
MEAMRRFLLYLVILGGVGADAWAQPNYFEVPDVPTDLTGSGPVTRLPWDIVLNSDGLYSVAVALPPTTPVDAIHQLPTGDWLLSVPIPTNLGGIDWSRRDVFLWDGDLLFEPYPPYDGAAAQIPLGSNVDAVFVDPTGAVVVSFDVPTTIGAVTYEAADLVRYDGISFNAIPFFDASAAGFPPEADLTAADRSGLLTVFSMHEPTTVGTFTALPGELLSWNGVALGLFDPQPAWPVDRSSRVNALTFPPTPAGTSPGNIATLTVDRLDAAQLLLVWTASDCSGGEGTAIYQGTLASLHLPVPVYDHQSIDCNDTFPFLQESITLPAVDAYFLVVAESNSAGDEGSYGTDNRAGVMTERPVGATTCQPLQVLSCP